MKLFYSPGACSFAPHIVLAEIGKPFDTALVSTSDGSTQSDTYLELNPKGRVPLLVDGELQMTEASAIMTYLAASNPESKLLDTEPLQLARTIEWMNWLATVHAHNIAQNWRAERFTDDENAFKGIQVKGMENLIETYTLIDRKLQQSKWAVGNQYSIADPYLLVFFRWGNRLSVDMRQFKHWQKHALQMESRDAVQHALNAESISLWE